MKPIKLLSVLALVFVFSVTSFVAAEDTKGTIKSVDLKRNEVVLKGLVKDTVYELSKSTYIYLDGVEGKLADLRETDKAVINYEKKGEHLIASQVRGLRNAEETSGTIRDIFGTKNEITMKGIVKDTTYELEKGGTVWLNDKRASLTDLRAGDEVRVTHQKKGDHNMAADVRAWRK